MALNSGRFYNNDSTQVAVYMGKKDVFAIIGQPHPDQCRLSRSEKWGRRVVSHRLDTLWYTRPNPPNSRASGAVPYLPQRRKFEGFLKPSRLTAALPTWKDQDNHTHTHTRTHLRCLWQEFFSGWWMVMRHSLRLRWLRWYEKVLGIFIMANKNGVF